MRIEKKTYNILNLPANDSCPCKHLDIPCYPECACVNSLSSSGCWYCCTYGSKEQQKVSAIQIDKKLKL